MFARAIASDAIAGGARPRGVSSLFRWRGENGDQIMPKKVAKKNTGASLANAVAFRKILETGTWEFFLGHLPLAIGLRDDERPIVADLTTLPHLLVAGESDACRAACLNSLICGLLATKTSEELQLILANTHEAGFAALYKDLPHLVAPVIIDPKRIVFSLKWATLEMEKRMKLCIQAQVRNFEEFNDRVDDSLVAEPKKLPAIVIVLDDLADVLLTKENQQSFMRLLCKGRIVGIHLVAATKNPRDKYLGGAFASGLASCLTFKTETADDSKTVIGTGLAANLEPGGALLFKANGKPLMLAKGVAISDAEIRRVVASACKRGKAEAAYDAKGKTKVVLRENENGVLFKTTAPAVEKTSDEDDVTTAVKCLLETHRASTSHFQRWMGWGYNHAAHVIDLLTDRGIVAPPHGAGPRQILKSSVELKKLLKDRGKKR